MAELKYSRIKILTKLYNRLFNRIWKATADNSIMNSRDLS